MNREHPDIVKKLHALETEYQIGKKEQNQRKMSISLYLLGFYYSEKREFITSFGKFRSFSFLLQWLKKKLRIQQDQLDVPAGELMETATYQGKNIIIPTAYFAAWLILQGKGRYLRKEEGLN